MTETHVPPRASHFSATLLLGLLSALGPLSIDMYLPGLPQIGSALHVDPGAAQHTVAVFFAGMAIGQLVYGPLSDRLGRRGPLLAGLMLYIAATIGCALAPSIDILLAMRLLQAFGGCAGMVIARAVVRDRFAAHETVHVYSLLMLVVGISPILSPLFGGWILLIGSWRTIFWLLAGLGVVLTVAAVVAMAESRSEDSALFARNEHYLRSYLALLRNREVVGFVLAGAFANAAMGTYVASSPALLIGVYQVPVQSFGWIFGINGIALIGSSQINARLARRMAPDTILRWANRITLGIAAIMLADAVSGFGGIWGVLVPLFLVIASLGFNQPNALAGAMAMQPMRAGSVSALIGCAQFGIGAICATIAGGLLDGTARPMAAVIAGTTLIAVIVLKIFVPHKVAALHPSPRQKIPAA